MSSFILQPLPAGDVDARAEGTHRRIADDRSPCRRCLRDAAPGDPLVLASYDPFLVRSPYAGKGPVFVHAEGCEPFDAVPGAVSEQVAGRVLSLRAYDGEAMMTEAEVIEGERLAERASALLADEGVAFLHAHFAGAGCFAFRVDRA
jgi:Protein of unknown function (DUF1203)